MSRTDSEQHLDHLNGEIERLTDEKYALECKVEDHDEEIEERESTIRDRDEDIEDLNDEIKELKKRMISDQERTELSTKMNEYQSTVPGTPLCTEVGEEVKELIRSVLDKLFGDEGPITIP